MAPTKPRSSSGKGDSKRNSKSSGGSSSKPTSKPKKPTKTSKTSAPKSKPVTAKEKWMKKKASYSEKELGIQKLNMITPAGVQKVKGKKKGKVFVDDQASMMTLLAMVNAEKEGQIESKMIKARQMEEIRQARQEEMDKRKDEKKSKLEDTKDSLRRSKNKKPVVSQESRSLGSGTPNVPKKRVSFG